MGLGSPGKTGECTVFPPLPQRKGAHVILGSESVHRSHSQTRPRCAHTPGIQISDSFCSKKLGSSLRGSGALLCPDAYLHFLSPCLSECSVRLLSQPWIDVEKTKNSAGFSYPLSHLRVLILWAKCSYSPSHLPKSLFLMIFMTKSFHVH